MRVNSQGRFNVPPGSYTNPKICDEDVLRASSLALQDVIILGPGDATELIGNLPKNRKIFLFVDPPYHHPPKKKSKNGGKFIGYSGEFTETHQRELVEALLQSSHKFIYTNRATDFIVGQFTGVTTEIIKLKHSIQPKYTTGAKDEELIASRLT
jgi:DNA adenine methylase